MKPIRWLLAAVAALVLIVGIFAVWSSRNTSPLIKDKPFNDLVAAGIQLKIDQSTRLFELTLLVTGALWGLIIAKKDEAGILLSDAPEVIMFACANVLLLASFWCHVTYLEDLGYVYSVAGGIYQTNGPYTIPDVFDSRLNNFYRAQLWILATGIAVTVITFFSAHRLKPQTP